MADGGSIVGAAAGWGISAVGSIVSPIITDLLYKGFSYLGIDRSEKLKELETKVLQLKLVLESLEKSPDKRLERLLQRLKSALYDAEDIFDDVEYYRLERQILPQRGDKSESDVMPPREENSLMKKLKSAMASKRPRLEKETSVTMSGDVPPDMSKSKLKKIVDEIENIIDEAHKVVKLLNLPSNSKVDERLLVSTNSRSAVTTTKPLDVVIGRDEDRDKFLALLHETETDGQQEPNGALSHSIIGIYGIPGSGKSTLAQLICAHEKKEGHFELVMWIHVSQNFSLNRIFSEMLEEATGNTCPEFKSLNTLEQKLNEALSEKQFLLVLDDVWYNRGDSQKELQKIVSPLNVGKAGSKILVTSRRADALSALGAGKCIPISDMNDNVFLKLFMHYALDGANIDAQDRRRFVVIGADIAKKLRRSPLAARTVGGQLRRRPNVEFWRDTRDRNLLDDTKGALWWSYQHLHEQVRRCFSYCSIFPSRHLFKRDELVTLWVAEGFVRTTNTKDELEAVGRQYFDELVSSSFLVKQTGLFGSKDYFTVHDLLHDLAKNIAGSACFTIQRGWTGDLPPDVRHLFIEAYDDKMITERILEMGSLRTLIICMNNAEMMAEETVFETIFTGMRKLRVLRVEHFRVGTQNMLSFPKSIDKLKHLRYFGFPTGCLFQQIFPITITKLYHLQVLDFGSCGEIVFSSKEDLSKLVNLRHLISPQVLSIQNFDRLYSLQTIPTVEVQGKVGYGIHQLKHLNNLRGKLHIRGLEYVEGKEAAVEANLAAKERLKELVLDWCHLFKRCPVDVQEEVLEGLCPPTELEVLEVSDYKGSRYPSWLMGQQNGPKLLCKVKLARSSPLRYIPECFTHLRSLRLYMCSWDSLPDNMERLASLEELILESCNGISLLPVLPQSLETFLVAFCTPEFMNSCRTIDHPNWQRIKHIKNKLIRR